MEKIAYKKLKKLYKNSMKLMLKRSFSVQFLLQRKPHPDNTMTTRFVTTQLDRLHIEHLTVFPLDSFFIFACFLITLHKRFFVIPFFNPMLVNFLTLLKATYEIPCAISLSPRSITIWN